MLTETGVSIYNKVLVNRETKYIKSYIEKAHWEEGQGANIEKTGLQEANIATIFVPVNNNFSKIYVQAFEFKNYEKEFTFNKGDIIVKGETEEDEVKSIKELEKKYSFVHTINMVDFLHFGSEKMQHWEIGAK